MKKMIGVCSQIAFLCALAYSIAGIYGNGAERFWYFPVIAAGCAGGHFAREKLRRLFLFLAAHIAFASAAFLLARFFSVSEGYFVLAVVLAAGSVLIRLVPSLAAAEEPGYLQLAVLAVVFAMDSYLEMDREASVTLLFFFAMILAKILYANLKSAEAFVFNREASTKMDREDFYAKSRWVSVLYVAALGMLLSLTGRIHAGVLFDKIWEGIKAILRFFFRFLERSGTKAQEFTEEMTVSPETPASETLVVEPSLLAKILNEIIRITTAAVLAAIAIAVLAAFFLAVYRRFYRKENRKISGKDETETLRVEWGVRKKRKKVWKISERGPSNKIRRIYKKSMNRFWGKNADVPGALDPAEQIAYARALMRENDSDGGGWPGNLSEEQCEEIRRIYEKARYSEETVTSEELSYFSRAGMRIDCAFRGSLWKR